LRENVFGIIDVFDEFEVINLSDIAMVQIFFNEKLEEIFRWWNQFQFFHNSSKLFDSYMATFGSVIVLELRLYHNSLVNDLNSNGLK